MGIQMRTAVKYLQFLNKIYNKDFTERSELYTYAGISRATCSALKNMKIIDGDFNYLYNNPPTIELAYEVVNNTYRLYPNKKLKKETKKVNDIDNVLSKSAKSKDSDKIEIVKQLLEFLNS